MTPQARRDALLAWLREHPGALVSDARHIPAYWDKMYGSDMAHADLLALERAGLVRRLPGRPARWEAVG